MHLLQAMPAQDFLAYQAYAEERLLPLHRIELHLARIGKQLDLLAGRTGRPVEEYLIPNPKANTPTQTTDELTDEQAQALAQSIGFNPKPRPRRTEPPDPNPETPGP